MGDPQGSYGSARVHAVQKEVDALNWRKKMKGTPSLSLLLWRSPGHRTPESGRRPQDSNQDEFLFRRIRRPSQIAGKDTERIRAILSGFRGILYCYGREKQSHIGVGMILTRLLRISILNHQA